MTAASIKTLISSVGNIIDITIVLLASMGVLVFLYGVVKFVFKSGSEDNQEEGRNLMVWGLVALFVMMGVWGIIGLVQGDLGIQSRLTPGEGIIGGQENGGTVDQGDCSDKWSCWEAN